MVEQLDQIVFVSLLQGEVNADKLLNFAIFLRDTLSSLGLDTKDDGFAECRGREVNVVFDLYTQPRHFSYHGFNFLKDIFIAHCSEELSVLRDEARVKGEFKVLLMT